MKIEGDKVLTNLYITYLLQFSIYFSTHLKYITKVINWLVYCYKKKSRCTSFA